MTFLWILLSIMYIACRALVGLATPPQTALLGVLDRLLRSDPDHRRADLVDQARSAPACRSDLPWHHPLQGMTVRRGQTNLGIR